MSPARRLLVHVLLLAAAGATVSVADGLHRSHMGYHLGRGAGGLLCADHGFRNCNDIAAHPLAWPLRVPLTIPLAAFSLLLACLAVTATIFRGPDRAAHLALGTILSGLGSLLAAALLAHSILVIGRLCLTALLLAALCALSWRTFGALEAAARQPVQWSRLVPGPALWRGSRGESYRELLKLGTLALLTLVGWSAFRRAREPLDHLHRFEDSVLATMKRSLDAPVPGTILEPSGGTAIGPPLVQVTIILAGDYQDALSRAAAQDLERVRAGWPDHVRVAWMHLPLDPACNPAARETVNDAACLLARAASCAAEQGRFAELHRHLVSGVAAGDAHRALDAIEALGLDPVRFRACLEAQPSLDAVTEDAGRCQAAGLDVVPSFVINGAVRAGAIPPRALRTLVRYLLEDSRSSSALNTDSSAPGRIVPSRR
jgi:protein-disulfide isomerase